jgi:hypothetical protein
VSPSGVFEAKAGPEMLLDVVSPSQRGQSMQSQWAKKPELLQSGTALRKGKLPDFAIISP